MIPIVMPEGPGELRNERPGDGERPGDTARGDIPGDIRVGELLGAGDHRSEGRGGSGSTSRGSAETVP